jgi:hypothetical protein
MQLCQLDTKWIYSLLLGVYEGMYDDIMSVSNKQFQEVLDELEEEEEVCIQLASPFEQILNRSFREKRNMNLSVKDQNQRKKDFYQMIWRILVSELLQTNLVMMMKVVSSFCDLFC